MKKYKLSSEAVFDIEEGKDYYNALALELGVDFFYEFKKTVNLIRQFPEIGIFHLRNIRKFSMDRFHHIVYYIYEKDTIYVLAVIHETRGPNYLDRRLKDII